uniref:Uncharacterized protein n=1 Tax=Psilocybe cubensis TaxID=181762 RepID=A0A8H8CNS1_PSICU
MSMSKARQRRSRAQHTPGTVDVRESLKNEDVEKRHIANPIDMFTKNADNASRAHYGHVLLSSRPCTLKTDPAAQREMLEARTDDADRLATQREWQAGSSAGLHVHCDLHLVCRCMAVGVLDLIAWTSDGAPDEYAVHRDAE